MKNRKILLLGIAFLLVAAIGGRLYARQAAKGFGHHLAQAFEGFIVQFALEFEIQFEPFLLQDMCEQQLNRQPGRLDAGYLKVRRRLVEDVQDAHARLSARSCLACDASPPAEAP